MTREEAIKALREMLTEATEFENSVCYVTEEDREPLEMAIKALEHPEQNVIAVVPCGDAISRQAVLDAIDDIDKTACMNEYHSIVKAIEDLPSVQPIRPLGRWIYDRRRDWDGECAYECSECGRGSDDDHDYCPNCGAKMAQESEDKCKNCKYSRNPDYTRCHECEAERSDRE